MRRTAAAAALLLLLVPAARSATAEPAKLLRPDQYQARVVAPRKGKVLVVNFWATWCAPCREEMPDLVAASHRFAAKDVSFAVVSVDTSADSPQKVPKFLADLKVPFVSWLARTHDPATFIDAVDPAWDGSVPYTVVYGRDGKAAAKLSGRQSEAAFAAAVEKALDARKP